MILQSKITLLNAADAAAQPNPCPAQPYIYPCRCVARHCQVIVCHRRQSSFSQTVPCPWLWKLTALPRATAAWIRTPAPPGGSYATANRKTTQHARLFRPSSEQIVSSESMACCKRQWFHFFIRNEMICSKSLLGVAVFNDNHIKWQQVKISKEKI